MKGHAKPLEQSGTPGDVLGLRAPERTAPAAPADADVHDAVVAKDEHETTFEEQLKLPALPMEQREVTAILVRTSSILVVPRLQNTINEGQQAQVVLPILEIFTLFDVFVKPVQLVLLVLTAMICVVSGVSILVSIYNSMAGRRHEIAVIRALGASRGAVLSIVLIESIMLSIGGGVIGWLLGHVLNGLASPIIERRTGVSVGFLDFAPKINIYEWLGGAGNVQWMSISSEILLVPLLLILAVIVGFLPALAAYRTDVAGSLGK
jgi:putative ABC transport system permease protein